MSNSQLYVSLRDYFAALTVEHQRVHEVEKESSRLALDKAENALKARLESMNEFREQITDERGGYATREMLDSLREILGEIKQIMVNREVFEAAMRGMSERVRLMESKWDSLNGKILGLGAIFSILTIINIGIALWKQ